jgi:predicted XRE-type DNA-binding protein
MIRKEINIITGEEKTIQLTQQEINELNIKKIEAEQYRVSELAKEEQEKARKESAIAKLKALGLTEEEVKSIL